MFIEIVGPIPTGGPNGPIWKVNVYDKSGKLLGEFPCVTEQEAYDIKSGLTDALTNYQP